MHAAAPAPAPAALKSLLAAGKLPANDVPFAISLLRAKHPTAKQALWIGKLVERATAPAAAPATPVTVQVAGIRAMFDSASATLKHPRIRLVTADGTPVVLTIAGPTSKFPGTINVTDGSAYPSNAFFGRIAGDAFTPAPKCTGPVRALLAALSADPASVAAAHGKLTGACCFCARKLDDPKSLAVGYGPICADKYGLPH